jgi:transglutaminase-like putative cysteine protease
MIIEIQHETRFEYSAPARELLTELRMEPTSDADQSCHSFHLEVSPRAELFRYLDGFGTRVHHFNLLGTYDHVRMLAAAVVETHPRRLDLADSRATWPLCLDDADLSVHDMVKLRGPVRHTPRLAPLLERLRPESGMMVGTLVAEVSRYIHEHFEYARDVTLASSPVEHLLEHGKGVCQDFTHLMLAILRSFEVPARYVSGYIHRHNKESQTHAWCEMWLPDLGWVGIDPTNDCLINEHFVKVAVGRDFNDVPPNKGLYRGRGDETIFVRVETRELDRLPALSWQEQLPPLNVPLTAILPRPRPTARQDDETQQQQQ